MEINSIDIVTSGYILLDAFCQRAIMCIFLGTDKLAFVLQRNDN
jgi:hypothetical protein